MVQNVVSCISQSLSLSPTWAWELEKLRKLEQGKKVKSMKQDTHPSSQEIPTNGFANNQRQEDQEALVMFGLSKILTGLAGVIFKSLMFGRG